MLYRNFCLNFHKDQGKQRKLKSMWYCTWKVYCFKISHTQQKFQFTWFRIVKDAGDGGVKLHHRIVYYKFLLSSEWNSLKKIRKENLFISSSSSPNLLSLVSSHPDIVLCGERDFEWGAEVGGWVSASYIVIISDNLLKYSSGSMERNVQYRILGWLDCIALCARRWQRQQTVNQDETLDIINSRALMRFEARRSLTRHDNARGRIVL